MFFVLLLASRCQAVLRHPYTCASHLCVTAGQSNPPAPACGMPATAQIPSRQRPSTWRATPKALALLQGQTRQTSPAAAVCLTSASARLHWMVSTAHAQALDQ
eukprot:1161091-Pelagomonas_calceolata.AAC.6